MCILQSYLKPILSTICTLEKIERSVCTGQDKIIQRSPRRFNCMQHDQELQLHRSYSLRLTHFWPTLIERRTMKEDLEKQKEELDAVRAIQCD